MPVCFHKSAKEFHLGIWRMDESLNALHRLIRISTDDLATLNGFNSEYRKLEWLTTRVLVSQLLSATTEIPIAYNSNGKPRLVNSKYSISISHTKNFVAVLLSEKAHVGIDLETIQPRIEKIAQRFITVQEEQFIETDKKMIYQHVIWGTKEVLFKIYSKGALNFLENLHVKKFQLEVQGEIKGEIVKGDVRKEFNVFYEQWDKLMLVYAMGD